MAPLAATVAATVAVGVGLVLARSERERRRHPPHHGHDHELGLRPGETLTAGLRRMALAQVDLALELLGAGAANGASRAGGPDEEAVHETRKALKRLRALLRVLRHELGERGVERENAALRDIARELSASRDAAVMLATLDALIARYPGKLGRRPGVRALRRRLAAESSRVQGLTLADPSSRANVVGELHAFRWRVAAWPLPTEADLHLIEADLERVYRQGRARYRRAARGRGERTLALHMWRKRVKDLRYAAEMIEREEQPPPLHRLATRADALGELLGEEHDLAVLAERLRAGADAGEGIDTEATLWRTGRGTRLALLQAIARRRRKLRREGLRKGERLYAEKPRAFMRRVRAAYRASSRSQP